MSDLNSRDDIDDGDFLDQLGDDDIDTARQAARETAIMLGRRTILALSKMVHDPKFSAQSRVAAGNGILRAGGFFDRSHPEGHERQISEMSGAEITRELARLRRQVQARDATPLPADDDIAADTDDIFG